MTIPIANPPYGPPARSAPTTSRREVTAPRVARWRLRLLGYGVAQVVLMQLLLAAVLPGNLRLFSLQLWCVSLVFLGATPVIAGLIQNALIGLNRFRIRYDRLRPFYPRTTIIVPAWNEAAVIGMTITHLLGMEYPDDRLRVIVVDDASTDDTPAIVQAHSSADARVVHIRREQGGQGKSHTLNAGLARALADDWAEAVLIMDADVLFERDALRKMTRHFSDPTVGAVTAYIKEGSRPGNYLSRFIAYEYISAQAASRRAQNALGALACLAGGAQLHTRASLEAAGGRIDTSTHAEDTVTTFSTQLSGRRVVFEGNATVWAEEPHDLRSLWKQRLRWARGNVQVSLQFASLWGRTRGLSRLGSLPFALIWFTVLLMPILMFGSSVGLIVLFFIGRATAWSVFSVLWIWHAVAFVFGMLMMYAVDPKAMRRSWIQAILFPGVVSLLVMAYSVYPPLFTVHAVHALDLLGITVNAMARSVLTLFMYAWLFVCMPLAYAAKRWEGTKRFRWLAPATIYVVGFGPFLCAVTFASYINEIFNTRSVWDKTIKSGGIAMGDV
ncbi:MAG: glycosyltransferase [bacterium]